ncbi:hypothetical protein EV127DRAFT_410194 [Xylaria flabelliformis]|nr:hypothetical protein EV127DRAFT_410194 [Xylaria flabelliformis]
MLLPAVLAALSFTILTEAQNFSSYVPECAPPCVEQTLNNTKVCTSLNDNKCLCTNFQPIVFSARICFVQTCNNTDVGALRCMYKVYCLSLIAPGLKRHLAWYLSKEGLGTETDTQTAEITSGWQKFCNDSGTPLDLSSGFPGGPESPQNPAPSSSVTTSATPSIPSTSSSTSIVTSSSTAPSETVSATSSDLTTGAKAGIGVGVGVGSLAVIGGLVFLGFRLGQQKRRRDRNEAEDTSPTNEGGHLEDGHAIASATQNTTVAGTTAEVEGDHWAYAKEQPEGAVLAELPSPRAELPADVVRRELPAHERPIELWHGVMPPELSADSELPSDRTTRL